MQNLCHFSEGGKCRVLRNNKTFQPRDGRDEKCSFFKTTEQYIADRDRAIDTNRAKGKCYDCKYNSKPCKKYHEGTADNEGM